MRLLMLKFYDGYIKQNKSTTNYMKLKKLSILAGAVALTLSAIPFSAQAEISSSSPTVVARAQRNKGQGKFKRLNLTEDQKAQLQEIKKSARAEMKQILTPDQLQKLQEAKASGQKKRGIFRSLNLTEDQKAKLKKVRESKKRQIEAILTEEKKLNYNKCVKIAEIVAEAN